MSTGAGAARRAARRQRQALELQRREDQARIAEADSVVERRKVISQNASSRSSLLATAETGVAGQMQLAKTLGG